MSDLGNSQEQAALVKVSDGVYGQHKQDAIPKDATKGGSVGNTHDTLLPMPKTDVPAAGCNK